MYYALEFDCKTKDDHDLLEDLVYVICLHLLYLKTGSKDDHSNTVSPCTLKGHKPC